MNEHPRLFAIGDLHLPGGSDKPMDVFGDHWAGHFSRIAASWRSMVGEGDIVLIPGDISWGMQLTNAREDLESIGAMPGRKVIIRGNHDYWWGAISKLRGILPKGMYALQNDALLLDGIAIAGSRGWTRPLDPEDSENAKIYAWELVRMSLSLEAGRKLSPEGPLVAMSHFPPVDPSGMDTPLSDLMAKHRVSDVVYGHLHGQAHLTAFRGIRKGVRYHCVSCDSLNFSLMPLPKARVAAEVA